MRYLSYTEHDPVMAFGAGFPPDYHTQNVSNEPMTLGLPAIFSSLLDFILLRAWSCTICLYASSIVGKSRKLVVTTSAILKFF
jgi:hypothetical protein